MRPIRDIDMEDIAVYCHLRRIGPQATTPVAVNHMRFYKTVSIIGRSPKDCDFIIDSSNEKRRMYISRIHARVVRQVGTEIAIHVIHDDSRNGVFINNIKINGSVRLEEGDRVTFGHYNGEPIAPGTRCRQPASEYQFIFERCNCSENCDSHKSPSTHGTDSTIIPASEIQKSEKRSDSLKRETTTSEVIWTRPNIPISTSQPVNSQSTNDVVICNRPAIRTEMSVEGVQDSLINNNITSEPPTMVMSTVCSFYSSMSSIERTKFSSMPLVSNNSDTDRFQSALSSMPIPTNADAANDQVNLIPRVQPGTNADTANDQVNLIPHVQPGTSIDTNGNNLAVNIRRKDDENGNIDIPQGSDVKSKRDCNKLPVVEDKTHQPQTERSNFDLEGSVRDFSSEEKSLEEKDSGGGQGSNEHSLGMEDLDFKNKNTDENVVALLSYKDDIYSIKRKTDENTDMTRKGYKETQDDTINSVNANLQGDKLNDGDFESDNRIISDVMEYSSREENIQPAEYSDCVTRNMEFKDFERSSWSECSSHDSSESLRDCLPYCKKHHIRERGSQEYDSYSCHGNRRDSLSSISSIHSEGNIVENEPKFHELDVQELSNDLDEEENAFISKDEGNHGGEEDQEQQKLYDELREKQSQISDKEQQEVCTEVSEQSEICCEGVKNQLKVCPVVSEEQSEICTEALKEQPKVNSEVLEEQPEVNTEALKEHPEVSTEVLENQPEVVSEVGGDEPEVNTEVLEKQPEVNTEVLEEQLKVVSEVVKDQPEVRTEDIEEQPEVVTKVGEEQQEVAEVREEQSKVTDVMEDQSVVTEVREDQPEVNNEVMGKQPEDDTEVREEQPEIVTEVKEGQTAIGTEVREAQSEDVEDDHEGHLEVPFDDEQLAVIEDGNVKPTEHLAGIVTVKSNDPPEFVKDISDDHLAVLDDIDEGWLEIEEVTSQGQSEVVEGTKECQIEVVDTDDKCQPESEEDTQENQQEFVEESDEDLLEFVEDASQDLCEVVDGIKECQQELVDTGKCQSDSVAVPYEGQIESEEDTNSCQLDFLADNEGQAVVLENNGSSQTQSIKDTNEGQLDVTENIGRGQPYVNFVEGQPDVLENFVEGQTEVFENTGRKLTDIVEYVGKDQLDVLEISSGGQTESVKNFSEGQLNVLEEIGKGQHEVIDIGQQVVEGIDNGLPETLEDKGEGQQEIVENTVEDQLEVSVDINEGQPEVTDTTSDKVPKNYCTDENYLKTANNITNDPSDVNFETIIDQPKSNEVKDVQSVVVGIPLTSKVLSVTNSNDQDEKLIESSREISNGTTDDEKHFLDLENHQAKDAGSRLFLIGTGNHQNFIDMDEIRQWEDKQYNMYTSQNTDTGESFHLEEEDCSAVLCDDKSQLHISYNNCIHQKAEHPTVEVENLDDSVYQQEVGIKMTCNNHDIVQVNHNLVKDEEDKSDNSSTVDVTEEYDLEEEIGGSGDEIEDISRKDDDFFHSFYENESFVRNSTLVSGQLQIGCRTGEKENLNASPRMGYSDVHSFAVHETPAVNDSETLATAINDNNSTVATINDDETPVTIINDNVTLVTAINDCKTAVAAIDDHETSVADIRDKERTETTINDNETPVVAINDHETSVADINDKERTETTINDNETPVAAINDHETSVAAINDNETPVVAINDHETSVADINDKERTETTINDNETPVAAINDHETSVAAIDGHEILGAAIHDHGIPGTPVNGHDNIEILESAVNDHTTEITNINDRNYHETPVTAINKCDDSAMKTSDVNDYVNNEKQKTATSDCMTEVLEEITLSDSLSLILPVGACASSRHKTQLNSSQTFSDGTCASSVDNSQLNLSQTFSESTCVSSLDNSQLNSSQTFSDGTCASSVDNSQLNLSQTFSESTCVSSLDNSQLNSSQTFSYGTCGSPSQRTQLSLSQTFSEGISASLENLNSFQSLSEGTCAVRESSGAISLVVEDSFQVTDASTTIIESDLDLTRNISAELSKGLDTDRTSAGLESDLDPDFTRNISAEVSEAIDIDRTSASLESDLDPDFTRNISAELSKGLDTDRTSAGLESDLDPDFTRNISAEVSEAIDIDRTSASLESDLDPDLSNFTRNISAELSEGINTDRTSAGLDSDLDPDSSSFTRNISTDLSEGLDTDRTCSGLKSDLADRLNIDRTSAALESDMASDLSNVTKNTSVEFAKGLYTDGTNGGMESDLASDFSNLIKNTSTEFSEGPDTDRSNSGLTSDLASDLSNLIKNTSTEFAEGPVTDRTDNGQEFELASDLSNLTKNISTKMVEGLDTDRTKSDPESDLATSLLNNTKNTSTEFADRIDMDRDRSVSELQGTTLSRIQNHDSGLSVEDKHSGNTSVELDKTYLSLKKDTDGTNLFLFDSVGNMKETLSRKVLDKPASADFQIDVGQPNCIIDDNVELVSVEPLTTTEPESISKELSCQMPSIHTMISDVVHEFFRIKEVVKKFKADTVKSSRPEDMTFVEDNERNPNVHINTFHNKESEGMLHIAGNLPTEKIDKSTEGTSEPKSEVLRLSFQEASNPGSNEVMKPHSNEVYIPESDVTNQRTSVSEDNDSGDQETKSKVGDYFIDQETKSKVGDHFIDQKPGSQVTDHEPDIDKIQNFTSLQQDTDRSIKVRNGSRKRKQSFDGDLGEETVKRRKMADIGRMVTEFFNIKEYMSKFKPLSSKSLKKRLVGKYVANFFNNSNFNPAPFSIQSPATLDMMNSFSKGYRETEESSTKLMGYETADKVGKEQDDGVITESEELKELIINLECDQIVQTGSSLEDNVNSQGTDYLLESRHTDSESRNNPKYEEVLIGPQFCMDPVSLALNFANIRKLCKNDLDRNLNSIDTEEGKNISRFDVEKGDCDDVIFNEMNKDLKVHKQDKANNELSHYKPPEDGQKTGIYSRFINSSDVTPCTVTTADAELDDGEICFASKRTHERIDSGDSVETVPTEVQDFSTECSNDQDDKLGELVCSTGESLDSLPCAEECELLKKSSHEYGKESSDHMSTDHSEESQSILDIEFIAEKFEENKILRKTNSIETDITEDSFVFSEVQDDSSSGGMSCYDESTSTKNNFTGREISPKVQDESSSVEKSCYIENASTENNFIGSEISPDVQDESSYEGFSQFSERTSTENDTHGSDISLEVQGESSLLEKSCYNESASTENCSVGSVMSHDMQDENRRRQSHLIDSINSDNKNVDMDIIDVVEIKKQEETFSNILNFNDISRSEVERCQNASESTAVDLHYNLSLPDIEISSDGSSYNSYNERCATPVQPKIPLIDLYDFTGEESDSLPEVAFLRESPAKHVIVKKESDFDSVLTSDIVEQFEDTVKENKHKEVLNISSELNLKDFVPQECETPAKQNLRCRESSLLKVTPSEETSRKKKVYKKKCDPSLRKNRMDTSESEEGEETVKSPIKMKFRKNSPEKNKSRLETGKKSSLKLSSWRGSSMKAVSEETISEADGERKIKMTPTKAEPVGNEQNKGLSDSPARQMLRKRKPLRNKESVINETSEKSVHKDKSRLTPVKTDNITGKPVSPLGATQNFRKGLGLLKKKRMQKDIEDLIEILTDEESDENEGVVMLREKKKEKPVDIDDIGGKSFELETDTSSVDLDAIVKEMSQTTEEQGKQESQGENTVTATQNSISDIDNIQSEESNGSLQGEVQHIQSEESNGSVQRIVQHIQSEESNGSLQGEVQHTHSEKGNGSLQREVQHIQSEESNGSLQGKVQHVTQTENKMRNAAHPYVVRYIAEQSGSKAVVSNDQTVSMECYENRTSPAVSEMSSNTVVQDSVSDDEGGSCVNRLPRLNLPDFTIENIHDGQKQCSNKTTDVKYVRNSFMDSCTFEDSMDEFEEGSSISNIVNFLENETVCYSDLNQELSDEAGEEKRDELDPPATCPARSEGLSPLVPFGGSLVSRNESESYEMAKLVEFERIGDTEMSGDVVDNEHTEFGNKNGIELDRAGTVISLQWSDHSNDNEAVTQQSQNISHLNGSNVPTHQKQNIGRSHTGSESPTHHNKDETIDQSATVLHESGYETLRHHVQSLSGPETPVASSSRAGYGTDNTRTTGQAHTTVIGESGSENYTHNSCVTSPSFNSLAVTSILSYDQFQETARACQFETSTPIEVEAAALRRLKALEKIVKEKSLQQKSMAVDSNNQAADKVSQSDSTVFLSSDNQDGDTFMYSHEKRTEATVLYSHDHQSNNSVICTGDKQADATVPYTPRDNLDGIRLFSPVATMPYTHGENIDGNQANATMQYTHGENIDGNQANATMPYTHGENIDGNQANATMLYTHGENIDGNQANATMPYTTGDNIDGSRLSAPEDHDSLLDEDENQLICEQLDQLASGCPDNSTVNNCLLVGGDQTIPSATCGSQSGSSTNVSTKIKYEASSPEETISKAKAMSVLEKLRAKKRKFEISKSESPDIPRAAAGERTQDPEPVLCYSLKVKRCGELIENLLKALSKEKGIRNHRRIDDWISELDQLQSSLSLPQVTIAVVGSTGAGKSSLMNAIIDHYNILPTSGTQACTAVVVRIENNDRNDQFEAEIEFMSEQEWEHEVKLLKGDVTTKKGRLIQVNFDPETDAGVAFLKMRAVYGKFNTLKDICRTTAVTRHLGKTETVTASMPAEFRNKINRFIGSVGSETDGGQYWPIIKTVTIRIPQCDVCSNGCTLIDLPGIGDSNAARDQVAKEYLKNCTVILIVTEVQRAVSSKTAKELLGENFRRQLLMDGNYGNVAFICTKNDDVQPSELISELKLKPETEPLEMVVKSMMNKIDKLKESKNGLQLEITQLEAEVDGLNGTLDELVHVIKEIENMASLIDLEDEKELNDLKSDLERKNKKLSSKKQNLEYKNQRLTATTTEIYKLKSKIKCKRKEIKMICAKARASYAKKEIKKDYKTGIREMKRKAEMTQDQIDEYEEGDYASDEEDEELMKSCDRLNVFCVSSSEYQKLKDQQITDGSSKVFDTLDDTEIPALRQFIQETCKTKKDEATKRIIQNLSVLIFHIQNYLTESGLTSKDDRLAVQSTVEDFSSQLMQELLPLIETLCTDVFSEVDKKISVRLNIGTEVAVCSAVPTATKWAAPVKNGGLHFSTYKATVCRHGEYKSKTMENKINFNEDLTKPISNGISMVWNRFFSVDLWTILERSCRLILCALKKYVDKLLKKLLAANVPKNQLDTTKKSFEHTAENKLSEMMKNLRKFVGEEQKNISRLFSPIIKEHLGSVYDDCLNDQGDGMFTRMKNKLETGVDKHRHTMFEASSSKLLADLKQLMDKIVEKFREVCTNLCECLQAAFEPLWTTTESSKQMRSSLFETITDAAVEVQTMCHSVGIRTISTDIYKSNTPSSSGNNILGQCHSQITTLDNLHEVLGCDGGIGSGSEVSANKKRRISNTVTSPGTGHGECVLDGRSPMFHGKKTLGLINKKSTPSASGSEEQVFPNQTAHVSTIGQSNVTNSKAQNYHVCLPSSGSQPGYVSLTTHTRPSTLATVLSGFVPIETTTGSGIMRIPQIYMQPNIQGAYPQQTSSGQTVCTQNLASTQSYPTRVPNISSNLVSFIRSQQVQSQGLVHQIKGVTLLPDKNVKSGIPMAINNVQPGVPVANQNIQLVVPVANQNIQLGVPVANQNVQFGVPVANQNVQPAVHVANQTTQPGVTVANQNVQNSMLVPPHLFKISSAAGVSILKNPPKLVASAVSQASIRPKLSQIQSSYGFQSSAALTGKSEVRTPVPQPQINIAYQQSLLNQSRAVTPRLVLVGSHQEMTVTNPGGNVEYQNSSPTYKLSQQTGTCTSPRIPLQRAVTPPTIIALQQPRLITTLSSLPLQKPRVITTLSSLAMRHSIAGQSCQPLSNQTPNKHSNVVSVLPKSQGFVSSEKVHDLTEKSSTSFSPWKSQMHSNIGTKAQLGHNVGCSKALSMQSSNIQIANFEVTQRPITATRLSIPCTGNIFQRDCNNQIWYLGKRKQTSGPSPLNPNVVTTAVILDTPGAIKQEPEENLRQKRRRMRDAQHDCIIISDSESD